MPKAPPFTAETAAEAGRKGAARTNYLRWVVGRQPKPQPLQPQTTTSDDSADNQRTIQQLRRIDEEIDAALERKDFETVSDLAGIKAKLWPLAKPTAGTLKPVRQKQTQRGSLNLGLLTDPSEPAVTGPAKPPTPQQVVVDTQSSDQNPKS